MHWAALLGGERSLDSLHALRTETAEQFSITEFTCDQCPAKGTCPYVFDPYNTDGDCLAEK